MYKEGVINIIFSDLEKICEPTMFNLVKLLCFPSGNVIRYNVWFRISQWARMNIIRKVLVFPVSYMMLRHYEFKYGIHANTRMYVGKGMHIVHGDGVYLNCKSIGDNFTCFQGVTLGVKNGGVPTVKKGVTIYPNAVVAGGVVLDDGCIIGAQSYVDKDVGEKKIVVGIPATEISKTCLE